MEARMWKVAADKCRCSQRADGCAQKGMGPEQHLKVQRV